MTHWQPSATVETLEIRAKLLANIRQFFAERKVLEVETPQLAQHSVTDPHLASFRTEYVGPGHAQGLSLYLQTSPEFSMKRLLCAGSGCIYQICKAYRNEESGRYHNPEFSMLEWYRVGFDHQQLMQEVADLLQVILHCKLPTYLSYQQTFIQYLGIDPLSCSLDELKDVASQQGFRDIAQQENNPDTLLQLLFSHCIEPQIGQEVPIFVFDFPATQAALARISPSDCRVAERFEVYFKGIELANGFHELADADEQQRRFQQDNQRRQQMGLPVITPDNYLLEALRSGLPDCAGVALGIDRLVMLASSNNNISNVQAFTIHSA
ncbi:elongation factor P--(R)-beta-lysine ligase [Alteromonadaceae bacterium BrNp21-10]|nr:elongation factor P--(R)-beta-lysine ligase [Alteromonadaceae bacterium BrNp21-10]